MAKTESKGRRKESNYFLENKEKMVTQRWKDLPEAM